MKISKVYFATGIRNWITAIWILESRNLRTRSVTGICSIGTGAYANAGAIGDASSLIVLARVPSAPSAGTVELPQPRLVKGVGNIRLDPIQTADALLELFRQRMKNAAGTP